MGGLDPLENHVLLDPAQKVNGALLATSFPVSEVDTRLIVDQQNSCAPRHTLAQTLGLDSLERAHVVLVQTLPGSQMP